MECDDFISIVVSLGLLGFRRAVISADGLWIAINIPPGPHFIELWGVVGSGEPQLIATTPVDIVADGITIADLYTGDDDGVKVDPVCTAPCSP